MLKKLFIAAWLINTTLTIFGQSNYNSSEVCLTQNEMDLYNAIMKYRKQLGLNNIPISPALSFVAQTHAEDLMINKPKQGNCNMHSWSNKGKWSSCCYTANHAQASCMWNKPRELTDYKGDGYEITFWKWQSDNANYTVSAQEALQGWQNSKGHNDVICNKEGWKKMQWNAIGIGIYENYACVWFGNIKDNETTLLICE